MLILIVPTDALLFLAVLIKPKRWISTFIIIAAGSALGAWILALLVNGGGEWIQHQLLPQIFHSPGWEKTEGYIHIHGLWALALFSAGPVPQQPAVVMAALAHISPFMIFLAVLVGRLAKYAFFAWLAFKSPDHFKIVSRQPPEPRQ